MLDDDSGWRARQATGLQDYLRRPGELFAHEWVGYTPKFDGPPIEKQWTVPSPDDRPNLVWEATDDFSRAWDEMRSSPDFDEWYEALRNHLVTQRDDGTGDNLVMLTDDGRLSRFA